MDDETRTGNIPGIALPLGPIILIVLIFFLLRKRKKSKEEQEFSRIKSAIDDTNLPDRAKDLLKAGVDEVRDAMATIREKTAELRGT